MIQDSYLGYNGGYINHTQKLDNVQYHIVWKSINLCYHFHGFMSIIITHIWKLVMS